MKPRELTIRGLILGALITTLFTAANVYLGLKVGLTFASSIPAAVISMAILSVVKDSSILENNIVQTVASAAGTLSAIIFVLPGLVIVGWVSRCLSGEVSRQAIAHYISFSQVDSKLSVGVLETQIISPGGLYDSVRIPVDLAHSAKSRLYDCKRL